jgi:2'-5' RNA ligase
MIKRCIMIFPQFDNMAQIDSIRDKYDPLAKLVRPHITLVFPFISDLAKAELEKHLHKVLVQMKPFKLRLQGIKGETGRFGSYLFLNIIEGKEQIVNIHKSLYTGILTPFHPNFLNENGGFFPHMTVGKLDDLTKHQQTVKQLAHFNESFDTEVRSISVEIIEENENSIIETVVAFA